MPQATNILLYDYSSQSEMLGDACLIAVLSSITMVLCLVDIVVKKQSKRKRRNKIYQRIQQNRRTIQSLYDEYGILFTRAYRMDYETFKVLHDLLKPGIDEYISNNKIELIAHQQEICLCFTDKMAKLNLTFVWELL